MGLETSFVSVTELGFSKTNIVLVTKPKLLLLPERITRDQREPGAILCEDRKRLSLRGVYNSWLLYVLPLYYHHAHVFESSRQEFPCSALPQQGQSS